MINTRLKHALVALSFVLVVPSAMAASTITLKATSAFPTQTDLTQQFLEFVKKVNNDSSLDIRINFLGGPEVVPPTQQADALQNGVITMSYGPCNYYFDSVPEGAALMAATINAPEVRDNGGMKLLDSFYRQKMHAHLLGWFGSGKHFFHIYTEKKPVFDSSGRIKGSLRLRSVNLYRDVLKGMGIEPMAIQVPDVYTALQRGVVKGVAWPLIGIGDLGWTDYLNYRVNPGFYNNTTIALINLDQWKQIPQDQRQRLQKMAAEFEAQSLHSFAALSDKIAKQTAADGMTVVTLEGSALKRYKKLVRQAPWDILRHYNGSHVKELKAHFTPGLQ